MKRTPLRRKTPLKAKKGLERKTRLKRSRLKRTGGPKRRGVMEVHKDDPDKYGELFERVREMECMGREWLVGHECGIGVAPPSAHHLEDKDSEGLLSVCGLLHDRLHEEWWKVERELREAGQPTLEEIGQLTIEQAERGQ